MACAETHIGATVPVLLCQCARESRPPAKHSEPATDGFAEHEASQIYHDYTFLTMKRIDGLEGLLDVLINEEDDVSQLCLGLVVAQQAVLGLQ